MESNTLLDVLLEQAGMSHAGLAMRVNVAGAACGLRLRYDHTAVARWLRGQRPRAPAPDLICDILGERLQRHLTHDDIGLGRHGTRAAVGVSLSGFVDRAAALWRVDHQSRFDVESAPAATGVAAVAPVWEWESPPHEVEVSRSGRQSADPLSVNVLRSARVRYERMYRQAGGVATRPRIVRFLNEQTAPLLRDSFSDEMDSRDLFRVAGGLVAVAGICAYDSNAQGLAQRYFHQALRLAKASGDRAFGGYVIALLVNQALFLGDFRQAVAFAEAGLRTAGSQVTPALATDLHAMQSKAYAGMGRSAETRSRMAAAEAAAARIRQIEEPPETEYVQPGLVEAQFAEALSSLGDFAAAREYAEEAVRSPAHARGRVHRLATLTTVHLSLEEIEAAATTAVTMVEEASGMESQRLRDRIQAVRTRLAHRGGRAATDAVERIDAYLSVPL